MKNLRTISKYFVVRVLLLKTFALCAMAPVAQPTLSEKTALEYAARHIKKEYIKEAGFPHLNKEELTKMVKTLNKVSKKIQGCYTFDDAENKQEIKDIVDNILENLALNINDFDLDSFMTKHKKNYKKTRKKVIEALEGKKKKKKKKKHSKKKKKDSNKKKSWKNIKEDDLLGFLIQKGLEKKIRI